MIDLIDNAVLFPHQINWRGGLRRPVRWDTRLATGVVGSENRASMSARPDMELGYDVLSIDYRDNLLMRRRALEALKRGRVAVPRWGSGVEIAQSFGSESFSVFDCCQRHEFKSGDRVIVQKWPSTGRNDERRINSGSLVDVGSWKLDSFVTGGQVATSASLADMANGRLVNSALQTIAATDKGLAPASVYETWRKIEQPGAGPVPDPIRYTFHSLQRESYLVRLHFCDMMFDGLTDHAAMELRVIGQGREVRTNFASDQVAARYRPFVIEFRAFPDLSGKIVVEVAALHSLFTGTYNAHIAAVELVSRTWEVFTLGSGSGREVLVLPSRSLGSFPDRTLVHPLLFGTPEVQTLGQLTDRYSNLKIGVREPLGDGPMIVTSCPAEVCDLTVPPDVDQELPVFGEHPACGLSLTGGAWEPLFGDDMSNNVTSFNPNATYRNLGHPNAGMAGLGQDVKLWWTSQIVDLWNAPGGGRDQTETLYNGTIVSEGVYYAPSTPVGGRWLVDWYYQGGHIQGAYNYTIFVGFCLQPNSP